MVYVPGHLFQRPSSSTFITDLTILLHVSTGLVALYFPQDWTTSNNYADTGIYKCGLLWTRLHS